MPHNPTLADKKKDLTLVQRRFQKHDKTKSAKLSTSTTKLLRLANIPSKNSQPQLCNLRKTSRAQKFKSICGAAHRTSSNHAGSKPVPLGDSAIDSTTRFYSLRDALFGYGSIARQYKALTWCQVNSPVVLHGFPSRSQCLHS